MTVKELKEQLNKFDDNFIVMIPMLSKKPDDPLPYMAVDRVTQGINELDCAVFLDDRICCESCKHEDCDPNLIPCIHCVDYSNWEDLN